MNLLTQIKNKKYRNAEMVKYWITEDAVEAKVMKQPEGHYVMQMQGEKYLFPGFPRGILLYGKLSKLKHEIKNQVFNETWRLLEEGVPRQQIHDYLDNVAWPNIYALADTMAYDMVPYEQLQPPVKEIWRAMDKVGVDERLKKVVCFVLQEDDAYRMRFQWMAKFFPWWRFAGRVDFIDAMKLSEEAEVVSDMKERQRLFRRITLFLMDEKFEAFIKEVDWSKVKLTKADKYFFRAKYFKVDYPEYAY